MVKVCVVIVALGQPSTCWAGLGAEGDVMELAIGHAQKKNQSCAEVEVR